MPDTKRAATKPLAITRTPVPDGLLIHWRCPNSPQCTRGQIRTGRQEVTPLLDSLEQLHRAHHGAGARS